MAYGHDEHRVVNEYSVRKINAYVDAVMARLTHDSKLMSVSMRYATVADVKAFKDWLKE